MGNSMLLAGFLESIANAFNALFQTIIQWTVGLTLNFVLNVIKCMLSIFLYTLSIFLLAIIDYIEMLFRGLAGLESNNGNKFHLSLQGKSGDLLIQMLTSDAVLEVFFATAIVGVFLLIITTIFSMIKVEYTTEGANNSKNGIIAKSLKSLCNMLIIPLLVILGVFIGNQVLGLIDTATGGGEGTKISGNLWVTGASTGLYVESSGVAESMLLAATAAGINPLTTYKSMAIAYSFQMAVEETASQTASTWGKEWKADQDTSWMGVLDNGTTHINPNRDSIESGFAKCEKGYRYYNIVNVGKYYNLFEINYLIILVGATVIIKSLYQCCFGLIDRLYRCTALFIVMPMVVGMSPVKDSLAKWRGDFIGRALSAYGIIISMNLFFTISKVLLSVDISFGTSGSGSLANNDFVAGDSMVLSNSLMVGLLRLAFVIVGCTFINKLAGDMAGYFGGTDVRATGEGVQNDSKKVVQDATAGIRKGIQIGGVVAKTIATGGMGIAAKIGSSIAFKNNMKDAQGGLTDARNNLEQARKGSAQATEDIDSADRNIERAEWRKNLATQRMEHAQSVLNDKNASKEDKEKAKATLDRESKAFYAADDKLDAAQKAKADAQERKSRFDQTQVSSTNQITEAQQKIDDLNTKKKEEQEKTRIKRAMVGEAIRGTVKKEFDTESVFDKYVTNPTVKDLKKSYKDSYAQLGSTSDEFKAIQDNEKKAKEKKEKEELEARHPWIADRRAAAAQTVSKAMIEKVEINNRDLNETLDKLANRYNNATDPEDKKYIISQMRALNSNIDTPAGGKFNISTNASYKVNFDTAGFKKAIEDAVKSNAKPQEIENIIQEQLKQWGQTGNDKLLKELHKAIEEIKNNLGK